MTAPNDRAEQRFDVLHHEHGPSVEPHFCRVWEGDRGCYGTNPDHGLSFEDAKAELIRWHEEQIAYIRKCTTAEELP